MSRDHAAPSSSSSGKSHAAAWWLLSLLAVPLLYVLLVPPVIYLGMRMSVIDSHTPPRWEQVVLTPFGWLSEHPPFQGPVNAYADWWLDIIFDEKVP